MSERDAILRADDVTKRYGAHTVLDRVSFQMHPGEIVALLGANGAGKTTLLTCLLGITPFEGDVLIGGHSVPGDGKRARRKIGYVPQLPSMHEHDRCGEALAFAAELKGAPRASIDSALEAVSLLPQKRARISELSGGMRQRLAMAAALLGDPQLLLLDEPTASLDADSQDHIELILRRLRADGRSVLVSTHMLARAEGLADRAIVLRDGAVAFDGALGDIMRRARGSRFVVDLNGHAPEAFRQALRDLGIGDERIASAAPTWDQLLDAVDDREVRR